MSWRVETRGCDVKLPIWIRVEILPVLEFNGIVKSDKTRDKAIQTPLLFMLCLVQCVTAAFFTLSFTHVCAFATSDLKAQGICLETFQNISALTVTNSYWRSELLNASSNLRLWYWRAVGDELQDFSKMSYHLSQALHVSAFALCQLIDFANSVISTSISSSLRLARMKLWSKSNSFGNACVNLQGLFTRIWISILTNIY